MNDFDLNTTLKAAKIPKPAEQFFNDLPRQITNQLRRGPPAQRDTLRWFPKLAWGLVTTAACLAIAFAMGYRGGRESSPDILLSAKLIRETLAMFPNRVRAIVEDEHGLSLALSENEDVPVSPPLWIKICDGKSCRTILTFSGQSLQIAKETVEVLVDAQGKVMLVGDQFVWSSADPGRATDRLRIQARPLAYSL